MGGEKNSNRREEVVFLNQDSGYLMVDIINKYVENGYRCTLVTGRLIERNIPLNASVKVERIVKYSRQNIFARLFTWTLGFIEMVVIIRRRYKKSHLFIVSNPPFAPLLPGYLKNKSILLIFDIYPDILCELGYFKKSSFIIKAWTKANRKAYSRALKIFTISEGMKQALRNYADGNKIFSVNIWTDNRFLKPVDRLTNPFIKYNNLSGKFIVMYSGNLGISSNAEILIEVAAKVDRNDIIMAIIGEGARKRAIRNTVVKMGLKNVVLFPWQAPSDFQNSLAAASVGVVTQGKGMSKLAVPSKLYNYLSVGAPVLCIAERESEVDNLVRTFECGCSFRSSEIEAIAAYIKNLADDYPLFCKLKANSLEASQNFKIDNAGKFMPDYAGKLLP